LERAVAELGGVRRAGQVAMADAVATAFDEPHHLLVQAGTGTGKSLGYLIPALRHVLNAKGRIVVATATLALQRQICTADLPVAARAVGGEIEGVLLKGRANYLCRYRLAGGYAKVDDALFDISDAGTGATSTPLAGEVARLREWAESTETGDHDELRPGPVARAWAHVSVSGRECLGPECPLVGECFAEQARAQAAGADIVVTNHTLLALEASSPGAILPEFHGLIVDEAHELADRMTSAFTLRLDATSVDRTVRAAAQVGADTAELSAARDRLGAELERLDEGRRRGALPHGLAEAVGAASSGARQALRTIDPQATGAAATRQFARARLEEVVEACDAIGLQDPDHVLWVQRTAADAALHLAPLSVAGLIRDSILGSATTIMTSATLSPGDDFAAAAGLMGFDPTERVRATDRPEEPDQRDGLETPSNPPRQARAWRALDVGSPFDYRAQGIVYLAAELPAPGREGTPPEQHDVLDRLIRASGGGALGLFTSKAAAARAADELRGRDLGVEILAQGEESLAALMQAVRLFILWGLLMSAVLTRSTAGVPAPPFEEKRAAPPLVWCALALLLLAQGLVYVMNALLMTRA
jgi:ATP-dependent DNA helicase DinG